MKRPSSSTSTENALAGATWTAGEARAFYDAAALAREWGFSEPGIRRLAARGEIPGARRVAGRWIFSRAVLEDFFRDSAAKETPTSTFRPAPSSDRPIRHSDLQRMWTSGNIRDAKGGGL